MGDITKGKVLGLGVPEIRDLSITEVRKCFMALGVNWDSHTRRYKSDMECRMALVRVIRIRRREIGGRVLKNQKSVEVKPLARRELYEDM